ncbi:MAG TPA: 3-phosphoserine/phosphohydroxythreonine transaminase [Spirochaetia bacterium]|nr:3-phosphoserine/phosphohydroxythreonine transaminase [Spirochaetia bacterium]
MERVFNFSAGPSMLPEPVLKQAASEMLNYRGSGQSVMEMSHRSKVFEAIIEEAESLVRELMPVPESYDVLFLQGGASLQFAMVPMNLMLVHKKAVYVDTGNWATKALEEARKFGEVVVAASSKDRTYTYIPKLGKLGDGADYVHITTNNTIYGTRYTTFPDTGNTPLVADMSSNIMSEPMDVSKFGLIYAGAQKNLGPAGVTLVIIRKDLVGDTLPGTPTMLSYKIHADNKSLYNTPPCYGVYIVGLVLKWLKDLGGIPAMAEINKRKASILYDFLDSSRLFKGTVEKKDRSLMNIPFVCPTEELNAAFLKEAEAKGFVNLKGHRTVGGMRASIYNAMPVEGVQKLVEFMKDFEKRNA